MRCYRDRVQGKIFPRLTQEITKNTQVWLQNAIYITDFLILELNALKMGNLMRFQVLINRLGLGKANRKDHRSDQFQSYDIP